MTRIDDFAPIESYGVIGDGESAALVADDGAIDWWATPALDSAPVFAALLDPEADGRFALEPSVPYTVQRRYLHGTNVLETTFSTADGSVRVIDSVNQSADGPLPWIELARDIQPVSGQVPMRWKITAGSRFGTGRPWARLSEVPLLHAGDLLVALVSEHTGVLQLGLGSFSGEFVATEGTGSLLALIAAADGPVVVPAAHEIRRRRDATVEAGHPGLDARLRPPDRTGHSPVLPAARRTGGRAV